MKMHYILYSFIFLFQIFTSLPCNENDYQQYFSPCDPITNTRTISIYLTKNCTTPSLPSPLISIYASLPSFIMKCGTKCPAGTIIHYDPLSQSTICQKCPEDTYSLGGDFKIVEDWTESSLENFQTHCYSMGLDDSRKNEDCTGLQISKDRKMITSGEVTGKQKKFVIQVIYFFDAKNSGRFILQYKKDAVEEQTNNYGEFKILFDYEPIIEDTDSDTSWKIISHDFESGKHEIVILYTYFKTNNQDLKFYIKSFEVIGIDDAAYKCEQCINSVAPEGSSKCFSCAANYYYDVNTKACIECPEGQYSISAISTIAKGCLLRKQCSDYDYIVSNVTKCLNGKKNVIYSTLQPSFCLDESIIDKVKTFSCDNKSYTLNQYEMISPVFNNGDANKNKCEDGYVLTSVFKLDLIDEHINDFWSYKKGWKNNGKELYTGLYISKPTKMILTKVFKLKYPRHAYMHILFSMDLNNDEVFKIKLGQDIISYSNTFKKDNVITLKIIPSVNQNYFSLIYEKNTNELKETNAVIIKHIEIYGSDLSNEMEYAKCPSGTISNKKDGCLSCIECDENSISNKEQTECINCSNIILQEGEYICGECPPYTYYSDGKCKLYEVLHNKNQKLKFNLNPMKKWINHLCNDQSGIMCYENAFIGPIIDNISSLSTIKDNNVHNLFFLSLFESKSINLYDFLHDKTSSKYKQGYIFGLFSFDNLINSSKNESGFINKNVHYQNFKIKKNIATRISKVNLLSNKKSILIEYVEGDICLNDISKRYKSYLYLNCYKYKITSPKLVNIIDDKCTFIFEWDNPFLCKNCIINELTNIEVGVCKNGLRQIIFNANDDCSIFNASDSKLIGYDKSFNDSLLNTSDFYIKLNNTQIKNTDIETQKDNNKGDYVYKNEENVSFPFEYIEDKFYYEECTIIKNVEKGLVKYLIIIIPVIYLFTIFLVLCYLVKYRRVKNEYERIRNTEVRIEESNDNREIDNSGLIIQEGNVTKEIYNSGIHIEEGNVENVESGIEEESKKIINKSDEL